jgi:hypothetical protein
MRGRFGEVKVIGWQEELWIGPKGHNKNFTGLEVFFAQLKIKGQY